MSLIAREEWDVVRRIVLPVLERRGDRPALLMTFRIVEGENNLMSVAVNPDLGMCRKCLLAAIAAGVDEWFRRHDEAPDCGRHA